MSNFLQKGSAKFLLILVFLTAPGSYAISFAQASFTAVCPQKKIGKNDYLQVQFKVENASHVETIIPPSFKNFSIASGPNQENGMTSINGKVDQYVSVSYYLKPNSPGHYTIGSAVAKADGKEFHSKPLDVEVTNSATQSSSANSPANSLSAFGNPLAPFGNMNFYFPTEPATHRFDDYIL